MFLGDKGKPNEFEQTRRNYDIIIDNERLTLQKLSRGLGFYNVVPEGTAHEVEIVYDTDRKLLTGAGLILRKKMNEKRAYFSLVRISTMNNVQQREKKSFLGECEPKDQPSNFPVQIADGINKIFNNLFTVNVADIVQHCTPYVRIEILGNKYKIISGTGYQAEMSFETLKIRDLRTGRHAERRNFSLNTELNPQYERERQHILDVIDHKCKELFFVNRNRFEIAEAAVKIHEPKPNQKNGEQKKTKKQIKAEIKAKKKQEQEQEQE